MTKSNRKTGEYVSDTGNPFTAVFFYCFCFFFSLSCLIPGKSAGEIVDRIVAVVNDDIITLFELNRVSDPYIQKIRETDYSHAKKEELIFKVRDDVLKQIIDQKLTDQEVKRANITVSEKEVDNAVERVKQAGSYSDERLRDILKQEGLTMEEYRSRIREQILRTKLVNLEVKSKIVLTDEDIKAYYDEHADEYRGNRKYQLRNILLMISPFAGESDKEEIRQRMEAILQEFKNGIPFATLAREFSESSLAEEGGYLGEINYDDIAPQIKAALAGHTAGEITDIVETEQGFQLFYIENISQGSGKKLEEVSSEIEEKLYNDIVNRQFKTWLEELRERSHIKIIR